MIKREPVYCYDGTVWIFLTQGKVAIVDAIDSDLADLQWSAAIHKKGRIWYAVRHRWENGKRVTIRLHREVAGRVSNVNGLDVDHENRDGLDCRRSNLRPATPSENSMNTAVRRDNKSGFKGVGWHSKQKKWIASIRVNYKLIHLGSFDSPEEAAKAREEAARRLHGEFARTA